MRNYVIMQVQQREAYGRFTVFMRIWRNWKHRKDVRRLLEMDDYMLRDVGLTRETLDQIAKLPLTADQVWEGERPKNRS